MNTKAETRIKLIEFAVPRKGGEDKIKIEGIEIKIPYRIWEWENGFFTIGTSRLPINGAGTTPQEAFINFKQKTEEYILPLLNERPSKIKKFLKAAGLEDRDKKFISEDVITEKHGYFQTVLINEKK